MFSSFCEYLASFPSSLKFDGDVTHLVHIYSSGNEATESGTMVLVSSPSDDAVAANGDDSVLRYVRLNSDSDIKHKSRLHYVELQR